MYNGSLIARVWMYKSELLNKVNAAASTPAIREPGHAPANPSRKCNVQPEQQTVECARTP